jgi:hypothetical protein
MDDSVRVRCSRCNSTFRDRAGRIRSGYSRECPSCNVLLWFEDESSDVEIKRALKEARRIRNAINDSA